MVAVAAIPTDAKNPLQSCSVIALTAFPMALMRVRFVRAAAVRSSALTFDHMFSSGLRSGAGRTVWHRVIQSTPRLR